MGLIIKPNVTVEDILIQLDTNAERDAGRIVNEWGKNIPVIKIGDYVLNIGDLENFSLKVALNCLPSFTMTVKDEQFKIRESLKNNIDKCVIFIGNKNWYIKFNGILDTTFSDAGDVSIFLTGKVYNEKLYAGYQKSHKGLSIVDIFSDICNMTSMGLFTVDNPDLNKVIDFSLMTGTRCIDYFDNIIKTYTRNLYSIDPFYHYHVVDIDRLRGLSIDKYSLSWKTGDPLDSEHDIILKSIVRDDKTVEGDEFKIPIKHYSIDTNFSDIHTKTYQNYNIGYGGDNPEVLLSSNQNLGIGDNKTNTFFGFEKHKNPFYTDVINKKIGGNLIKIYLESVILELLPFSIVNFECYLPLTNEKQMRLDEEHSGKKIVIGYTIDFERINKEFNKMSQTIELI